MPRTYDLLLSHTQSHTHIQHTLAAIQFIDAEIADKNTSEDVGLSPDDDDDGDDDD